MRAFSETPDRSLCMDDQRKREPLPAPNNSRMRLRTLVSGENHEGGPGCDIADRTRTRRQRHPIHEVLADAGFNLYSGLTTLHQGEYVGAFPNVLF
jgi:hypothetical protein